MKQCRGKENWRKEGEGMQRLVHFCRTGRTGGGVVVAVHSFINYPEFGR